MSLELTYPTWLGGLIALPVLIYFFGRSLVDFARWQLWLSLIIRSLIVVLMVLALCGIVLLMPSHEPFVVLCVDDSASVGANGRQTAQQFVEQVKKVAGSRPVVVLPFAAQPRLQPTSSGNPVDESDPWRQETNLEAALRTAASAIPPGYVPHVVLLSDGYQTVGDGMGAALNSPFPVSTVPLAPRAEPDVQVTALHLPTEVRQEEPFKLEVVIDSNCEDDGVVEIFCSGFRIASQAVHVKPGENPIPFTQSLSEQRLAEYRVELHRFAKDKQPDNNRGLGLVSVIGKPKVLLIEAEPRQGRNLASALQKEGIEVDVFPPQGLPDSLSRLQAYEMVILSNVPASDLNQRKMEALRTYVQELGGGFLMLGGENSFGLGGYFRTPIEEILPVRSDFDREKEKPTLGMVLVIDQSGSMQGQKIELAKEAAKGAIELLGPKDQVGVLAFESRNHWITDKMQPCTNKSSVLDAVSRMTAEGGTMISPALAEAFEVLQGTNAKLKHVILMTDGQPDPSDPRNFAELASKMQSMKVTCSTVGVGTDADRAVLEEIAQAGGGRSYFTTDPSSLPQIFAKETLQATQSAINNDPFKPLVFRQSPVLGDLDLENAPELFGYVVTKPKETSEQILMTENGDPLLTWWRYGLGMTVAFTSDAKSRWASEWIPWRGFSKFWAQVVRHAMRKADQRGMTVQVAPMGRTARVTADVFNLVGQSINQADAELTIVAPNQQSQKLKLSQSAPGRYVAEFPTPQQGAYQLDVSVKHENGISRQTRGLAVGYPDELRLRPVNEELLRSMAQVSGGRYSVPPADVFDVGDRAAWRGVPLWPYLTMMALALFAIDVALRRVDYGGWVERLRYRSRRWHGRKSSAFDAPAKQLS